MYLHYKKNSYLRRPKALAKGEKPSLGKKVLATSWRPLGVRKTGVAKFCDDPGRQ
jgi:hypothetical protein